MEDALLAACEFPTPYRRKDEFRALTDDELIGLLKKHADATTESSRLASYAMLELVCRGDANAIEFAEQHFEDDDSPHCQNAVYALLQRYELPSEVEHWQTLHAKYDGGFKPNSPVGIFILAGWIHDEFMLGNEHCALMEDWSQKEAYESAIPALEQIHSASAATYKKIISILSESDAQPTESQNDELNTLSSKLVDSLDEWMLLRHLVRHHEDFRNEFKHNSK